MGDGPVWASNPVIRADPESLMSATDHRPSSPAILWTGRVLSTLPCLLLTMSAGSKLAQVPDAVKGFADFGFPDGVVLPIGLIEITSVILYVFPRTSMLGAILASAYLGGACATHIHAGQNFAAPMIVSMLMWAGLALRDTRVRALLPLM
jgi:hypothetical protein